MTKATLKSRLRTVPYAGAVAASANRLVATPRAEAVALYDLARTWREARFVREHGFPTADGPLALVFSVNDSIFVLKLEALFATALRQLGWRVAIVLGSRQHDRARSYFRAFGLRDFIYLDEAPVDEAALRRGEDAVRRLLAGDISVRDIKGWSFDGAWIGSQVLSWVGRIAHKTAIDFGAPDLRRQLAAELERGVAGVLRARALIEKLQPRLGVANEVNYAQWGPLVDHTIALGGSVIQFVQPWRDDALFCKRLVPETRRLHPASISPETFAAIDAEPWTAQKEAELGAVFADLYGGKWVRQRVNQQNTERFDASAVIAELGLDPAKKTAAVFSHVLWDANLFWGEDLFEDYGEWFVETLRAAAANERVNWIVKLHPANRWKRQLDGVDTELAELALIRRHLGELPPHVKLVLPETKISADSLYPLIDWGVTVRGTIGMELPCFGIPALTAGTGRYSGLGFTEDSSSREEYIGRLGRIDEIGRLGPEAILRAKKHAHAVFTRRPWLMKSIRCTFNLPYRANYPLNQNVELTVASMAAMDAAGDLRAWAEWAVSARLDYLNS
jgi:hypothetical protein